MPGSDSKGFEDALESPEHTPLSLAYAPKYASLADDNLEPAEAHALPAPVSPAPLSPYYSTDSEPIKDDPQEAKEDAKEKPSKEEDDELLAPAASTLAIANPASPSEETEPFEENETPLPPSIDVRIEAWRAAPTHPSPLPSPLSPLSSPIPMIPSQPLPSSLIHRDTIPKADLPPRKRARSSHRFEIEDSYAAAVVRHPGKDSHEMYKRHQDAQDDRAVLRARIVTPPDGAWTEYVSEGVTS
ncbi:hypothetical protein Tco_0096406 [Tanacetum coccineum]